MYNSTRINTHHPSSGKTVFYYKRSLIKESDICRKPGCRTCYNPHEADILCEKKDCGEFCGNLHNKKILCMNFPCKLKVCTKIHGDENLTSTRCKKNECLKGSDCGYLHYYGQQIVNGKERPPILSQREQEESDRLSVIPCHNFPCKYANCRKLHTEKNLYRTICSNNPCTKVGCEYTHRIEQKKYANYPYVHQSLPTKYPTDSDFGDDDCFVKKPYHQAAPPPPPPPKVEEVFVKKFSTDSDFENDDCFVKKPYTQPPPPPPKVEEVIVKKIPEELDFDENGFLITFPKTREVELIPCKNYPCTDPNCDKIHTSDNLTTTICKYKQCFKDDCKYTHTHTQKIDPKTTYCVNYPCTYPTCKRIHTNHNLTTTICPKKKCFKENCKYSHNEGQRVDVTKINCWNYPCTYPTCKKIHTEINLTTTICDKSKCFKEGCNYTHIEGQKVEEIIIEEDSDVEIPKVQEVQEPRKYFSYRNLITNALRDSSAKPSSAMKPIYRM